MPLRPSLLPADILYNVLILLPLDAIANVIELLTGTSKLIALHVFKTKVLHEILNDTSDVLIAAPTLSSTARTHCAVQLVIATRSQITIHFTPTQVTGPANEAMFLELISEVTLEIQQPMPQERNGGNIKFGTLEDKSIRPKKYVNWEIVSTRAGQNIYKFTLDNEIENHPIRDYFAKRLNVYVKVRIMDRGLCKVEDVYFNFQDLFFICIDLLCVVIYINV
jgi:hypothetical protein